MLSIDVGARLRGDYATMMASNIAAVRAGVMSADEARPGSTRRRGRPDPGAGDRRAAWRDQWGRAAQWRGAELIGRASFRTGGASVAALVARSCEAGPN